MRVCADDFLSYQCKFRSKFSCQNETQAWLESLYGASLAGRAFKLGAGCHQCHNSGYAGRIGVYELLWADDVPDAVAISEAVALVQSLSTDESSSFVNGLLARILEVKPHLALDGG